MISSAQVLSFVAMLNLWWLECAQNPAVFCYRIGWDLLAPLYRSVCRPGARREPTAECSN